ncbi:AmmeMemoRadiSam system radical SAM enzyme [Solemya pervernicosa gill symbiont]|uniref:AmmeMemoRadiSam system radical SAM enzyme n=1 Tax=Solemya pervernicosa gill symbiont TaxID=642797 RepID=A0A1T2L0Z2_9GAMM|nr:AmmeMemoRadiSam system radical SAM enzyme [Solemya pervernicosa gill symbiont]
MVETRLQTKLDNGITRCDLCLWRCKLSHGQRGFCQAHVNRNGTLYNLSYGIVSSMEVGPIEDKPVKHYRPGSKVLSVGSYGCNFRCGGCHNLEISWGTEALDELARGESKAAYVTPDELVEAALRQGVEGIAFTYSEPAVWLEYLLDVSEAAYRAGLYTVYVTNSFVTDEALELMAPQVDVVCSDIKSMRDEFYHQVCPVGSVSEVLDSIEKAQRLGIHVETRTNIIPGYNDGPEELRQIAEWIRDHLGAESPWHITRFFPAYKLSDVEATPAETLWQAHDIACEVGLTNVYVYDDKGCDCAAENLPVEAFLNADDAQVHAVKKCSASCCGDDGVLLKRYEEELPR